MAKRRMGITLLLIVLCLCFSVTPVFAASTTDAKEPISIYSDCELTLKYTVDGVAAESASGTVELSSSLNYHVVINAVINGVTYTGTSTNAII